MSTLSRAITIAVSVHEGQTDKGGAPYILYPLRVMQAAFVRGGLEAAIAAVLHDVVEDGPFWDVDDLCREGFAPSIIRAVDALTRRPNETHEIMINSKFGRNWTSLLLSHN